MHFNKLEQETGYIDRQSLVSVRKWRKQAHRHLIQGTDYIWARGSGEQVMVLEGSGLWECREENTVAFPDFPDLRTVFHHHNSLCSIPCNPFTRNYSFKCIVGKQREAQKKLSTQGDPILVCVLCASPITDATFLSIPMNF